MPTSRSDGSPSIERPNWSGDEGGASEIAPSDVPAEDDSDSSSALVRRDWPDDSKDEDDPNAALIESGAFTKEEIESLQSGEVARLDPDKAPVKSEGGLDEGLLAEWKDAGGVEHHQQVAQGAVREMLNALPEAEASDLLQTFDTMPVGAQSAAYRELALTPRSRGTEQDALDRLDRIEASMSPSDLEAAAAWLKSRTPKQAVAILRALGG